MVDAAPAPEDVLPQLAKLLRGRVLVAHNAALRRARAAPGVRARRARVARPAGDLHGRSSRGASRRCSAAAGSRRWPARWGSRWTRSTARCRTRARARGSSARCSGACARTRRRSATRSRCSARARRRAAAAEGAARRAASARTSPALPHEPGRLHLPRRRRRAALRRQVGRPAHARAGALHRRRGVDGEAEHVDHQVTESELGALLLEDRLIKALRPPGNMRGKARAGRLRLPPLPAGHRVPDPRGRARAGRRATPSASGPCAAAPPRPSSSSSSTRSSACATAGARCPAASIRRPTARWAAASRPASRPRPERLPRAAGRGAALFVGRDGGAALLARVDEQIAEASAARRYERAAWLQRRRNRLEALLAGSAACCGRSTRARGSCSPRTPRRGALRRDLDRGRQGGRLGRGRRLIAAPRACARVAQAPRPAAGRVDARRGGRRGAAGRLVDRGQLAAFAGAGPSRRRGADRAVLGPERSERLTEGGGAANERRG